MKKLIAIVCGIAALSACTWVDLSEEAKAVSVISGQLPASCTKTGATTVSVVDKVLLERSSEKVAKELETMARNQAVGRGDAIMPNSDISAGEQSFNIYRCSQ